MMKSFSYFICLSIFFLISNITLAGVKADSLLIEQLQDSANIYMHKKPMRAIVLCNEALKIAQKIHAHPKQTMNSYYIMGLTQSFLGDNQNAIISFQKAFAANSKYHDTRKERWKGLILAYIGGCYLKIGNNQKGIQYITAGIFIHQKNNYAVGVMTGYNELGMFYYTLHDKEKSVNCFTKAQSICEKELLKKPTDTKLALHLYEIKNNLCFIYSETGQQKKALNILLDYLKSPYSKCDNYNLAMLINNIGTFYQLDKNYMLANEYYAKALRLSRLYNYPEVISLVMNNLAGMAFENKMYKKALQYYFTNDSLLQRANLPNERIDNLSKIYTCYEKLNNYKQALLYYKQLTILKDSISNSNTKIEIANAEQKFRLAQKNDVIIKQQKASVQTEKLFVLKQKRQQTIIIILISIIVIAVICFTAFRYVQKSKQKLQVQKEQSLRQRQQFIDVLTAQENERSRIAKDLHDGIGQLLGALKMNIEFLNTQANNAPTVLANIGNMTNELIEEVKNISFNIMPSSLEKYDLEKAIKHLVSYLQLSSPQSSFVMNFINTQNIVNATIKINLYRIVQELYSNAIKHSQAKVISIELKEENNSIQLVFKDDGIGFIATNNKKLTTGNGMKNIQSRLLIMDGSIYIEQQHNGTTIYITVPNQL